MDQSPRYLNKLILSINRQLKLDWPMAMVSTTYLVSAIENETYSSTRLGHVISRFLQNKENIFSRWMQYNYWLSHVDINTILNWSNNIILISIAHIINCTKWECNWHILNIPFEVSFVFSRWLTHYKSHKRVPFVTFFAPFVWSAKFVFFVQVVLLPFEPRG